MSRAKTNPRPRQSSAKCPFPGNPLPRKGPSGVTRRGQLRVRSGGQRPHSTFGVRPFLTRGANDQDGLTTSELAIYRQSSGSVIWVQIFFFRLRVGFVLLDS
ncbi:hypothetical protein JTE90_019387 [Oedothorax gibbosus]|uniref:Uncharacterized protein n=1 Tax=Oedothorax gibbosus TaxID=931172 RepID=A0AAV6UCS0_9ARAC|nr:hypothetical protein JTE90_019387 [Oedothorax gibbosus]